MTLVIFIFRKALRKVFDHVWVINLSTFSLRCDDHLRPKLFALLCLDMFSKCVYLSSASIVVENADEFFEDDKSSLKSLWCKTSNGPDLSFFFFKSERTHWESIWEIDGMQLFEAHYSVSEFNSEKISICVKCFCYYRDCD